MQKSPQVSNGSNFCVLCCVQYSDNSSTTRCGSHPFFWGLISRVLENHHFPDNNYNHKLSSFRFCLQQLSLSRVKIYGFSLMNLLFMAIHSNLLHSPFCRLILRFCKRKIRYPVWFSCTEDDCISLELLWLCLTNGCEILIHGWNGNGSIGMWRLSYSANVHSWSSKCTVFLLSHH